MSTAIPKTFEPLEIDVSGNRYHEPAANDHEKYIKLIELIDQAQSQIMGQKRTYSSVIEVGTWMGANAIELVAADQDRIVYCVDTWMGGMHTNGAVVDVLGRKAVFQQFCKNVKPWLFTRIIPCIGHSLTYAEIWPFQVGAIFIDAEHTYEACKADLEAWWPHVAPGGVIIGHDYEAVPGVTKAADEFGFDEQEGELFWKWK